MSDHTEIRATNERPEIQFAREWVEEWDYDADPHGYVHYRSIVLALLDEVDRYREALEGALHIAENPAKPANALDGIVSILRAAVGGDPE